MGNVFYFTANVFWSCSGSRSGGEKETSHDVVDRFLRLTGFTNSIRASGTVGDSR
jgi:hypothetical protein